MSWIQCFSRSRTPTPESPRVVVKMHIPRAPPRPTNKTFSGKSSCICILNKYFHVIFVCIFNLESHYLGNSVLVINAHEICTLLPPLFLFLLSKKWCRLESDWNTPWAKARAGLTFMMCKSQGQFLPKAYTFPPHKGCGYFEVMG